MKLLDVVVLVDDLPQQGLKKGMRGTIVESLAPDVFEVEFTDGNGKTVALASLTSSQLKPKNPRINIPLTNKSDSKKTFSVRSKLQKFGAKTSLKKTGGKEKSGLSFVIAKRLAREHPEIFSRFKRGEFSSLMAAAKAAGLVRQAKLPRRQRPQQWQPGENRRKPQNH